MDNADAILFKELQDAGIIIKENNVERIDSDTLFITVGKLVNQIDLLANLPTSAPNGVSERFSMGSKLAQHCTDLGFSGELGYDAFLYPSTQTVRSLLMFLLEKIPKKEVKLKESNLPDDFDDSKEKKEKKRRKKKKAKEEKKEGDECDEFCNCPKCFPELSLGKNSLHK